MLAKETNSTSLQRWKYVPINIFCYLLSLVRISLQSNGDSHHHLKNGILEILNQLEKICTVLFMVHF